MNIINLIEMKGERKWFSRLTLLTLYEFWPIDPLLVLLT